MNQTERTCKNPRNTQIKYAPYNRSKVAIPLCLFFKPNGSSTSYFVKRHVAQAFLPFWSWQNYLLLNTRNQQFAISINFGSFILFNISYLVATTISTYLRFTNLHRRQACQSKMYRRPSYAFMHSVKGPVVWSLSGHLKPKLKWNDWILLSYFHVLLDFNESCSACQWIRLTLVFEKDSNFTEKFHVWHLTDTI